MPSMQPCMRMLSVSRACCWSCTGALYGTYEAFRYRVPGLYKIRYIGQTTLSSAAVWSSPASQMFFHARCQLRHLHCRALQPRAPDVSR